MELFYDDENKDSSMFEKVKMGWFCPKCEMGIDDGD
jgi:rubredoxin